MSEECPFGHGKCAYGIGKFSNAHKCDTVVDELVKFRMAYCNPCLESLKLYEIREIRQELSWIREVQSNR